MKNFCIIPKFFCQIAELFNSGDSKQKSCKKILHRHFGAIASLSLCKWRHPVGVDSTHLPSTPISNQCSVYNIVLLKRRLLLSNF